MTTANGGKLSLVLLFLLAFLQLALETVLFQTVHYLYDYFASILYLGMILGFVGIGGSLAFIARELIERYHLEIIVFHAFSILTTLIAILNFAHWKILCLGLLALPFLFNSLLIAVYFAQFQAPLVYGILLLGSSTGLLFDYFFIPPLREEGILLTLAGFSFALPLLAWAKDRKWGWGVRIASLIYVVGLSAALFFNLTGDCLNFATDIRSYADEYRAKIYTQGWPDQKVISRGSLISRIDALPYQKDQKISYINIAMGGYSNDHILISRPEDFLYDRRLPHGILEDPSVLIMGTAAEGITKSAKSLGKGKVTGVEINPQIVTLMQKDFFEISQKAYADIDLHLMDGRAFLHQEKKLYDVITLMNTHHVQSVGQIGQPEYLHTKEAFKTYFSHLTPRGILVLEERNQNLRADLSIYRILETAMTAMKEMGIENPENHLVVYNQYVAPAHREYRVRRHFYTDILIYRSPLTEDQVDFYLTWLGINNYEVRQHFEKNNLLFSSYLPHETLGTALEHFILRQNNKSFETSFDLKPITDDQPFPFKIYPFEPDIGKILIFVALGLLGITCLVAIKVRGHPAPSFSPQGWRELAYFVLIGMGYMLFEISLLQKYQLILDSPTVVLIVILGGIFLFNAVAGFFLSPHCCDRKKIFSITCGILLLAVIYHLGFKPFSSFTSQLPSLIRLIMAILSLGPIGLLMGIPFPTGLELLGRQDAHLKSYFYGINGAAAGVGSVLAIHVAMHYGFALALILGGLCYAAAGLSIFLSSKSTYSSQVLKAT